MTRVSRRALVVAGPKAGKTSFAQEFLPREAGVLAFVNADLIAAGLSPLDPDRAAIRAARIMVREIRDHVARGEDFAFETKLADGATRKRSRAGRRRGST